MRGGHEQQPQIAWETVVNDVKKLVIWLDLGMLYLCPFSHPLIFQNLSPFISHIAICRGVQVPGSVNI